jgi:hypothetical protein
VIRVLFDECVPRKLKHSFLDYECETAPKLGFAGKGNGELLTLAEAAGFDVLLTVDRGMPYQQNLTGRKIAMLIVSAESNKLKALLPLIPHCLFALENIKPGQIVKVGVSRN